MLLGQLFVAESVVAEHQVVVRLQVFGIDRQHRLQNFHRLVILALQEQDASQIVQSPRGPADIAPARLRNRAAAPS